MKAAYIENYGDENTLMVGRQPQPATSDTQVLIKVSGAGVNPLDWLVRDGFLKDSGMHTLPLTLGWDVSGEVVKVGKNVTNLALGDEVFAYTPINEQGCYAQYVAVDSNIVAQKPQSITLLTAAAVPLAATTAWQGLVDGCKIKAGDRVLIHNAAGGVGSFAVQIAKELGAYVIGTASEAKAEYVKGLGVDEFIDYQQQDFEEAVTNVDAVFACVGGNNVVERSLKVLRNNGRLISLLDDMDSSLTLEKNIFFQRWMVMPNAEHLTKIANLIDSEKLTVHVEKVFPLEEVKLAHMLSQSKRVTGKIILSLY